MPNKYSTAQQVEDAAKSLLLHRHEQGESWTQLGKSLHVNRGLLNAMAHGKRRVSHNVLQKLGLPIIEVAATPVCTRCGKVHTRGCPKRRTKARSLFDLPVKELKRMIEERQEVK